MVTYTIIMLFVIVFVILNIANFLTYIQFYSSIFFINLQPISLNFVIFQFILYLYIFIITHF
jgi:hypothetical protein